MQAPGVNGGRMLVDECLGLSHEHLLAPTRLEVHVDEFVAQQRDEVRTDVLLEPVQRRLHDGVAVLVARRGVQHRHVGERLGHPPALDLLVLGEVVEIEERVRDELGGGRAERLGPIAGEMLANVRKHSLDRRVDGIGRRFGLGFDHVNRARHAPNRRAYHRRIRLAITHAPSPVPHPTAGGSVLLLPTTTYLAIPSLPHSEPECGVNESNSRRTCRGVTNKAGGRWGRMSNGS